MLIYVAHPYSGKEENKKAVEEKIKKLVKKHPRHTFISPIHTFGYMYNWVKDYDQGMQMCLTLLRKCDMLILCEDWNSSRGCNTEFEFARRNGIKSIGYKEALNTWKF